MTDVMDMTDAEYHRHLIDRLTDTVNFFVGQPPTAPVYMYHAKWSYFADDLKSAIMLNRQDSEYDIPDRILRFAWDYGVKSDLWIIGYDGADEDGEE